MELKHEIVFPLFLFLLAVLLTACGPTPEKVAKDYLEAATVGDKAVMKALWLLGPASEDTEDIDKDIQALRGKRLTRTELAIKNPITAVVKAEFQPDIGIVSVTLMEDAKAWWVQSVAYPSQEAEGN